MLVISNFSFCTALFNNSIKRGFLCEEPSINQHKVALLCQLATVISISKASLFDHMFSSGIIALIIQT